MSSSTNWRTQRRKLLLALLGRHAAVYAMPAAGLRERGRGSFRQFGFLIYEASLWTAGDEIAPPLALRLDYRRAVSGQAIVNASRREMRRLGAPEAALERWTSAMEAIFPDVAAGDHLIGLWDDDGARFRQDGRLLGVVPEPAFAAAFFGIWLDPRTRAPALRAALLGQAP